MTMTRSSVWGWRYWFADFWGVEGTAAVHEFWLFLFGGRFHCNLKDYIVYLGNKIIRFTLPSFSSSILCMLVCTLFGRPHLPKFLRWIRILWWLLLLLDLMPRRFPISLLQVARNWLQWGWSSDRYLRCLIGEKIREAEVIEDSDHKVDPGLVIDKSGFLSNDKKDEKQKDECTHHLLYT